MTQDESEAKFKEFDEKYFDGLLGGGTTVSVKPELEDLEGEDGACRRDGSEIVINPGDHHEWECTLIHEMVHAFEYRFRVPVTPEGQSAAEHFNRLKLIFEEHSAEFFSRLFEVMRARGDDPVDDLSRYFG